MLVPYLLIGEVAKPQGIQGEVKLRPLTDDPWRFEGLTSVYVLRKGDYVPQEIQVHRIQEDAVYLNFSGVTTREAAEALRGEKLYVARENARPLEENEAFICDLIGCEAVNAAGEKLGVLTDVLQPGGLDVYVFDTPKGRMMVPALLRAIPEVDVEARRVVLDEAVLAEVAVFDD